jgi:glycerophosphoryl diester phosphodiesterase
MTKYSRILLSLMLFCVSIFFTSCNTQEKKKLIIPDNFDLQGHRGARGLLPENTIPAFIEAINIGVNTLELDVVVSKDSQLVLSHEPFFSSKICLDEASKPITEADEKKYNIFQYTVAQIRAFDCGSIGNSRFPEQKKIKIGKPTLTEMVQAVEAYLKNKKLKKVLYNIETKSSPDGDSIFHPKPNVFAQLLYENLKSLNVLDRVYIQSFDVRTLQAFHILAPEVPLVLLIENTKTFEQNIEILGFMPAVYSPNYLLVNADLVKKVHEKNIRLIPWTVNETKDMKDMLSLGVDGLITDYPNRFQSIRKE